MLIYENGSGKYLRILPQAVQFVSSAHNATVVRADELEGIIRDNQLEYIRHTLELKRAGRDSSVVRDHVRNVLRKITG